MTNSLLLALRASYHRDICTDLLAKVIPKEIAHAALHELLITARANEPILKEQLDELEMLIAGRRLRDISDLPFDLAI